MRKSWVLWTIAFILTGAAGLYQRITGPSYPVRGKLTINHTTFRYRLIRTLEVTEEPSIQVKTGDPSIRGRLEWRRHKTADSWTGVPMQFHYDSLGAELPVLPPAAKLEYRIFLSSGGAEAVLPAEGAAVLRFKGHVPLWVLVLHIAAMLGGMLFSTRAGLEYFSPGDRLRVLIYWTIAFLIAGGAILGPLLQKYAFGAWWTGWPLGTDLTDNKTAIALLGWIGAAIALKRSRRPKAWAFAAAILLMAVYMIPHSLLGSELDYGAAPTGSAGR